MALSEKDINTLNDFGGFLSFKPTWAFRQFINSPAKTNFLTTGNQSMKTASTAFSYVLRVLGKHPVPKKNIVYYECEHRMDAKFDNEDGEHKGELKKDYLVKHESFDSSTFIVAKLPKDMKCPECGGKVILHQRGVRVFRFCSETLPGQAANVSKEGISAEVKNTQYPELKKWLPRFLIKKDITFRNPSMTVRDIHGGADIIIEFVSYNQSVQSTAGQQRVSIWLDEQPPLDFYEEQRPRLIKEDGDFIISCTPADRISWLYDEVFEKAKIYYRTKIIAERFKLKRIEVTDSTSDIAVFQAATDDNPTLSRDDIEALFEEWKSDPDTFDIRRYGVFKQVSGRIFKTFNWNVHVISAEKHFPAGMPYGWRMARLIDYHEHVPWAIPFVAISPYNEVFVWAELNPSPEKMVTLDIANDMARISKDYKFDLNLIDPLAAKTQTNTGTSVIDDLNRIFWMFKKEGLCTGGYWESGDTKSTIGRDEIRKRLRNAVLVGKPFNNIITRNGKKEYLATIWLLDNCKETAKSMKNWRLEEWAKQAQLATKDMKGTPQQKWSHFMTALEFIFKDRRFRPKPIQSMTKDKAHHHKEYFQGRAHV